MAPNATSLVLKSTGRTVQSISEVPSLLKRKRKTQLLPKCRRTTHSNYQLVFTFRNEAGRNVLEARLKSLANKNHSVNIHRLLKKVKSVSEKYFLTQTCIMQSMNVINVTNVPFVSNSGRNKIPLWALGRAKSKVGLFTRTFARISSKKWSWVRFKRWLTVPAAGFQNTGVRFAMPPVYLGLFLKSKLGPLITQHQHALLDLPLWSSLRKIASGWLEICLNVLPKCLSTKISTSLLKWAPHETSWGLDTTLPVLAALATS